VSELFKPSIRLVRLLAGTRQVVVVVVDTLLEEFEADDMSMQFEVQFESVDEFVILQSTQQPPQQPDMQFESAMQQPALEVQFETLDESAILQLAPEVQFEVQFETFDESAILQLAPEVQFELQFETVDEFVILQSPQQP
jgi:hypothetical protein